MREKRENERKEKQQGGWIRHSGDECNVERPEGLGWRNILQENVVIMSQP